MIKKFNPVQFLMDYLVLVAIVLLAIITVIVEPRFLTAENFSNLMRQFGPLSLVALGMTFVILGGFIDLSVPGTISLVAMVTLSLIDPLGQVGAIFAGLLLGTLLGLVNGSLLVGMGANTQAKALFITYGMSSVFIALALLYTDGRTLHMWELETSHAVFTAIGSGSVGIISVSFIIFLVCLGTLHIFQSKTVLGRSVSYTGGNMVAAELSGLSTKRIMVLIYTICGFMAALAAVVLISRVTTASPVMGKEFGTNPILAVVVGGTSLQGGRGGVLRTVLGVALVVVLSNCMNLLGVPPYMQVVMQGAILVTAIWLDHRRHNRG